ncbi:hypothetical protein ATERTT37_004835 [Aspergillus terreus]
MCTDITITNSHFYNGLGIALGSIGQYKDQFETIERFTVKNIDYHNTLHACTRFSGAPGEGNCTNSQFQIRDITLANLTGTTKVSSVASFQCSAVAPCTNIGLFHTDLTLSNGKIAGEYLCGNVEDPRGFECTGAPCVGGSATGEC